MTLKNHRTAAMPSVQHMLKAGLLAGVATAAMVAFSPSALAEPSNCSVEGNYMIFQCNPDGVNVRADSGDTSLTVAGLTVGGEGINYHALSSSTDPLSLTLSVNDTTVEATSYGGVNVYSDRQGSDMDLTLGQDVSITSLAGFGGIWARNETSGDIVVSSAADVDASAALSGGADGITATSNRGSVSVTNSGTVISRDARGLYADGNGDGITPINVLIVNHGDVTAELAGARAIARGGLGRIENYGSVTSNTKQALVAWSPDANVEIVNRGNATALAGVGIQGATQYGDVMVDNGGTVIAATGINAMAGSDTAEAGAGDVHVINSSGITATTGEGIIAWTPEGDVTVENSGMITSPTISINASSPAGKVSITNSGSVSGETGILISGNPNIGNDSTLISTIANTGSIVGSSYGIIVDGGFIEISNSGTISAGDGAGVAVRVNDGAAHLKLAETSAIAGDLAVLDGAGLGITPGIDMSLSNRILGSGLFAKLGDATLTLIGDSAEFEGDVMVQDGALALTGTLGAEDVHVAGGASLNISEGGLLSSFSVSIESDGPTATVTVSGEGSKWMNDNGIQIGRNLNSSALLSITDGGVVETRLGGLYMGAGGTIEISGAGSALMIGTAHSELPANWEAADGWFSADEGIISLSGGAKLVTDGSYIGGSGTGLAEMTVDGAGTVWENGLPLYIGGTGNDTVGHGKVTVSNGASVTAYTSALGVDAGSEGTLILSGAGTSYSVLSRDGYAGNMRFGYAGTGEALVENGASLTAAGLLDVASQSGSSGSLTIRSGGSVTGGRLSVGGQSETQGTISVEGVGSALTVGQASIGAGGTGSLDVLDGGLVTASAMEIGVEANATGSVRISGAGSSLVADLPITVGAGGHGTLTVADGGSVTTSRIEIGYSSGSTGVLNIGAASGESAGVAGAVNAGEIHFGHGSGTLVLNHTSQSYDLTAAINGAGSLVVESGTTRLAGTNGYSGGTTISGGTLIGSAGSFGSGAIVNNAALVIDQTADGTLANGMSGSGTLVKQGTGTVTLSGVSAFTGETSIKAGGILLTGALSGTVVIEQAGTLRVGNGLVDGDLTADAVNNGRLIFDQTGDYDYTGALSGNGGLVKRGAGVLLLSGEYSYTGSTIVEGGLVRLTSLLDSQTDLVVDSGTFDLGGKTQEVAGLSGTSGTLALGTTGDLTINQGSDSVFGGSITGQSSLTKTGTGSLNLTGVSTFSGTVDIDAGRLAVNGVLPGRITINSSGILGGTGRIGFVVVNSGGNLSPGNSIGTLNVDGNVVFQPGSLYTVEVDADGASDRIAATGSASIQGGTVSVLAAAGNYRWTSDYVILTATGGVTGTFSSTDVNLPFLTPSLRYGATDVVLTLTRNDRLFASAAVTPNQLAVSAALDGLEASDPLARAVAGQTDDAAARLAFDGLSGELWATTGTFIVDRARRSGDLVLGRLQQADAVSGALARSGSAATQARDGTAIWGQGIGSWNRVGSDGNAARVVQDEFGFVTGIDTPLGTWRIGAAFSYGEGKSRVDDRGSSAMVRSKTASLYAGGGWGALRVRLGGSHGWHDVDGNRSVAFPGVSQQVEGRYDAVSTTGFGELSYAARLGEATLEPFAGVNYVHMKSDAFAETGALVGLDVAEVVRDVTFTNLGFRLGTDIPVSDSASITPRVSVAWQHGFGDLEATGRHQLAGGPAFSLAGLPATRDAVAIQAGMQANILPGGSLGISYDGHIADGWRDHGLKLGFSYSF